MCQYGPACCMLMSLANTDVQLIARVLCSMYEVRCYFYNGILYICECKWSVLYYDVLPSGVLGDFGEVCIARSNCMSFHPPACTLSTLPYQRQKRATTSWCGWVFNLCSLDYNNTPIFANSLVNYQEIQFGELLGRGSYGTVRKGVWNGKTVALKSIALPPGVDRSQILACNQEIAALRYMDYAYNSIVLLLNIMSQLALHMHVDWWTIPTSYNSWDTLSATEFVIIMNYVSGKNLDELIFGTRKTCQCTLLHPW